MVNIKWKLERNKVFLEVIVPGKSVFYWFSKVGHNKRFHPRQIFTRKIYYPSQKDHLIPFYANYEDWKEGQLEDKIVREN